MNDASLPFSLEQLGLTGEPTTWVAIASAVLYLLGRWMARRGEKSDEQKRKAIQLAGDVRLAGLDFLSPLLEDYAMGDQAALARRIDAIAKELSEETTRKALLERLFNSQLVDRLRDVEARKRIAKFVEQVRPPVA